MTTRILALVLMLVMSVGKALADDVAVIDDERTTVLCQSKDKALCKFIRTVTILDSRGDDEAEFRIASSSTGKLTSFSGVMKDSAGKQLQKFKKSDLQVTEFSAELASEGTTNFFSVKPPVYPVTITYEWEVQLSGGLVGVPDFMPQSSTETPVRHASYSITAPAGMTIQYKVVNATWQVKESKDAEGRQQLSVEVNDLEAVRNEPYRRPLHEILPYVSFAPSQLNYYGISGTMDSWKSFGLWQNKLLEGRDDLPEDFKAKLRSMTDTCSTTKDKVAVLYRHLRETTRYVSIQLGIGGYQPMKASSVLKTGYGDCKALSFYMQSMLEALGIESHYTVISTNRRDIPHSVISPTHFNHVILCVPLQTDTLWLECTNPALRMGHLHHNISGHDAVMLTPDGGRLTKLPVCPAELNTDRTERDITLLANGDADIVLVEHDYEFEKTDTTRTHHHAFMKKAGRNFILPLGRVHTNMDIAPATQNRRLELYTGAPCIISDSIALHLPEGYAIEKLPQDEVVKSKYGTLTLKCSLQDDVLTVVYELANHGGNYPASDEADYNDFRKQMQTLYRKEVLMVKQSQ